MDLYYPQLAYITVDSDGFRVIAASEDIDYFNITQNVLIDTLTTDADGLIGQGAFSDGSFPVADGDVVEVRHDTYAGTARFVLKTSAEESAFAVENHVISVVLDDAFTTQEADAARVFAQDLTNPGVAAIEIGTASASGQTTLPFNAQDGEQYRIFIARTHKDFQFHAAEPEKLSGLDLSIGGGADAAPSFTSAAYDTPNSEVDIVFNKVGTATGDIQVEYKLTSSGSWTTHGTTFAHGATSGSFTITEQPSALTYDLRLKQVGVAGYSVTRQVTVDASGSGTPPSNLSATETYLSLCEWQIDLSWTAGSGSGNYTLERRLGSGGTWVEIDTAIASTSYSDSVFGGGGSSVVYYYRVKQNDVSGYSNQELMWLPRCFD